MSTYELADFHPDDGHLHGCPERPATCDCAGWLYCIAHDAGMTAEYGSPDGPVAPDTAEATCGASVSFEPPLPASGQPQDWPQTNFTCSLPIGHGTAHSDGLGFTWTDPFGRGPTNKASTSSALPLSTGGKGDSR